MLSQSAERGMNSGNGKSLHPVSARRKARQWECVVDESLIGDYLIVPLTTAKMLQSEAYWMNNCCREYTMLCAEKVYALFSVRSRSGERLATLGLISDQGYWRFDQCVGQSNSEVLEEVIEYVDDEGEPQTEYYPTELYYVAHEVVRLMNSSGASH